MHRPVIAAALAAGETVRGGNLGRDDARRVVRDGAASVPSAALLASAGWREDDQSRLEHEIDEGHCGALPAALWPRMALAGRARDTTLADAMLRAAQRGDRTLLVACNGHVRRDLGVPRYLVGAGIAPERIVAVGYLDGALPGADFDAVRVTAAAPRDDPCAVFRKR